MNVSGARSRTRQKKRSRKTRWRKPGNKTFGERNCRLRQLADMAAEGEALLN